MVKKKKIDIKSQDNILKGFGLIEILLVAATIPLLIIIAVTAINPAKKMAEARNIQRLSNIQAIINGIYQYSIRHDGNFPSSIEINEKEICKIEITKEDCTTANGVYLGDLLTKDNNYLATIPYDPGNEICNLPKNIGTCYYIKFSNTENSLIISAPNAELDKKIYISY